MASTLESFPPEMVDVIGQYLSLPDICHLRLVSRALDASVKQGVYKCYFKTKHVNLTRTCLETFVEMTEPGSLGCLVQNVVLNGIAIDTNELEETVRQTALWNGEGGSPQETKTSTDQVRNSKELDAVQANLSALNEWKGELASREGIDRNMELLSEVFDHLKTNAKLGRLLALSLSVVVYREDVNTSQSPIDGGDWETIWKAAEHTYHMSIRALGNSGLCVDRMDIFDNLDRCSLACNFASSLPEMSQLTKSLQSLRKLSVSLSERFVEEPEGRCDTEANRALATSDENFVGLRDLLQLTPQLEQLDLHWYKTNQCRFHPTFDLGDKQLQMIAASVELPSLKTLSLRGVSVSNDSLLRLLKRCPIKDLSLENVKFTPGLWDPVVRYCTSEEAGMERLYFDDLYDRRLVFFTGCGKSKFPFSQSTNGGQTLERKGADVRKPIEYHFANGRSLGSPQGYRWHMVRKRQYGPP